EWTGDFETQFADRVATVVRVSAGNPVDLARTGLDPVWALCSSSRQGLTLPPPLTNSWSVFPDSAVDYEDLLISLKARDNFSQLWDLPSFEEPLIVYAGPIDDAIIDWTAVEDLVAAQPAATILFIASNPQNATDPRSRVSQPARIQFLGVKRATEWHPYFSRAALLIAPLLKTVEAEAVTYDLMVAYGAAGKPILATAAIGPAGFQDAPNTLIAAPSNFGGASARALQMEPDLDVADRYLARKAPRALAAQIVAVANDRLFRRQSGDPGPQAGSHAAGSGRRASLPTILLETDSMHRGGLERVVLDMARALDNRRYRVALAVTGHAGDMADECRASGIAVHEVGRDRMAYERLLAAERPDLVIPHYSNFGAPLAWKRGIPVLSFIHNSYIWTTDELNREIRETDIFTTHYVAVSQTAAGFFSRKYSVPEQKITCIPNGIDLRGRDEPPGAPLQRADLGLQEGDFVVVCVASIVGTKAQIHAIAAVEALRREIPNLRLILVGGEADPVYSSLVREFIREAALSGSVLMTGHTNTVTAYYRMADAFLLSSLTEGWSLAKTEAMFHGLPLILTDVGGAAEVIEDSDIGILVPPAYDDPLQVNASNLAQYCTDRSPRNLEDLIQALRTMHRNRDSWREKGKLGKEKVLRYYDSEIIADRHCREIDRILSCHGYAEVSSQAAALTV
ncbi:MAG: glycosyltransferase, partial [Terriglobia bacterium]